MIVTREAGKRKTLRVGLRSPIRRVSRIFLCLLLFLFDYGGALRLPPILTKSVEFINKCLLFIFFKKPLDFSFLLCYYLDIKERKYSYEFELQNDS